MYGLHPSQPRYFPVPGQAQLVVQDPLMTPERLGRFGNLLMEYVEGSCFSVQQVTSFLVSEGALALFFTGTVVESVLFGREKTDIQLEVFVPPYVNFYLFFTRCVQFIIANTFCSPFIIPNRLIRCGQMTIMFPSGGRPHLFAHEAIAIQSILEPFYNVFHPSITLIPNGLIQDRNLAFELSQQKQIQLLFPEGATHFSFKALRLMMKGWTAPDEKFLEKSMLKLFEEGRDPKNFHQNLDLFLCVECFDDLERSLFLSNLHRYLIQFHSSQDLIEVVKSYLGEKVSEQIAETMDAERVEVTIHEKEILRIIAEYEKVLEKIGETVVAERVEAMIYEEEEIYQAHPLPEYVEAIDPEKTWQSVLEASEPLSEETVLLVLKNAKKCDAKMRLLLIQKLLPFARPSGKFAKEAIAVLEDQFSKIDDKKKQCFLENRPSPLLLMKSISLANLISWVKKGVPHASRLLIDRIEKDPSCLMLDPIEFKNMVVSCLEQGISVQPFLNLGKGKERGNFVLDFTVEDYRKCPHVFDDLLQTNKYAVKVYCNFISGSMLDEESVYDPIIDFLFAKVFVLAKHPSQRLDVKNTFMNMKMCPLNLSVEMAKWAESIKDTQLLTEALEIMLCLNFDTFFDFLRDLIDRGVWFSEGKLEDRQKKLTRCLLRMEYMISAEDRVEFDKIQRIYPDDLFKKAYQVLRSSLKIPSEGIDYKTFVAGYCSDFGKALKIFSKSSQGEAASFELIASFLERLEQFLGAMYRSVKGSNADAQQVRELLFDDLSAIMKLAQAGQQKLNKKDDIFDCLDWNLEEKFQKINYNIICVLLRRVEEEKTSRDFIDLFLTVPNTIAASSTQKYTVTFLKPELIVHEFFNQNQRNLIQLQLIKYLSARITKAPETDRLIYRVYISALRQKFHDLRLAGQIKTFSWEFFEFLLFSIESSTKLESADCKYFVLFALEYMEAFEMPELLKNLEKSVWTIDEERTSLNIFVKKITEKVICDMTIHCDVEKIRNRWLNLAMQLNFPSEIKEEFSRLSACYDSVEMATAYAENSKRFIDYTSAALSGMGNRTPLFIVVLLQTMHQKIAQNPQSGQECSGAIQWLAKKVLDAEFIATMQFEQEAIDFEERLERVFLEMVLAVKTAPFFKKLQKSLYEDIFSIFHKWLDRSVESAVYQEEKWREKFIVGATVFHKNCFDCDRLLDFREKIYVHREVPFVKACLEDLNAIITDILIEEKAQNEQAKAFVEGFYQNRRSLFSSLEKEATQEFKPTFKMFIKSYIYLQKETFAEEKECFVAICEKFDHPLPK